MPRKDFKKHVQETKCCPKCGRTLPLDKFYPNRGWSSQIFHDLWCKDCAARECINVNALQTYCFENNRAWKENLYDSAIRRAQKKLAVDPTYTRPTTPNKDKEALSNRTVAQAFFALMNLKGFYEYVDNGDAYPELKPDMRDVPSEEEERKKMVYSKRWRGYYTPDQIDTLEEIYSQYDRDFELSDVSMQDYAIKVAKASFHADQMYDRMRRGEASGADYKDALKVFDDLSKSSNFAACRRKPGEMTGLGSLGEIILRIEGTGKLNLDGDIWPQDSIDATVNDYRHIVEALGREGGV